MRCKLISVLYLAAFKKNILKTVKDMITVLRQIDSDFIFKYYGIKKWKMAKCHLAAF
jgi:hypothetical protein